MTEWFAAIGEVEESNAFREEDNRKVDRLEALYQHIGLPYERPVEFEARALTDRSPAFEQLLAERGDALCAIRLVPKTAELPKLRQRGVPLRECYEQWFLKQEIDPDAYIAYVCPHSETLLWSATFVIANDRIFGEIIRGLHSQLTHGETDAGLRQFAFDLSSWSWSEEDAEAADVIQQMLSLIRVTDPTKQTTLRETLSAEFSHDYLRGYFEATVWPDHKMYFIDYNRMLPKYIPEPNIQSAMPVTGTELRGASAQTGTATGRAVIVTPDTIETTIFNEGDILVCANTDVRFLPLMQKCGAIVTDKGGILSHAAIISRELKKPCLIGTKHATQTIKTGDRIHVDATTGVVRILG